MNSNSKNVFSLTDIQVVKEMDDVLSISELSKVLGGKVDLQSEQSGSDDKSCSCIFTNCNKNKD